MWRQVSAPRGVVHAVSEDEKGRRTGDELIREEKDGRTVYRCQGRDDTDVFFCLEVVIEEGAEPYYETKRRVCGRDETCTGPQNTWIRDRVTHLLCKIEEEGEATFKIWSAFREFQQLVCLIAA
ncbi:hypothetical protein HY375_03890 [Candidatus Berkelbacteria bacterium]|nr:hypothetical protein [Candidatus Berkelbacteria bacterium]